MPEQQNQAEKESYKNLSKETINLATGYYGKLPGRINDELLALVEKNQESISWARTSSPHPYLYSLIESVLEYFTIDWSLLG